jgi:zinc protease
MRRLLILLLLTSACVPPRAQDPMGRMLRLFGTDPDDLDSPLPTDPAVLQGRLDNGLTWYVQKNGTPANEAALWLVVKVGSVFEDDDQRGMAHFVEHMAFNGTEHFPGTALVKYLESTGAQFGAHLNAYTGFDETVFKLQVRNDPDDLDQAFLVLDDWASGIAFDPVEFERERGVVLEEWRTGQGLPDRMQQAVVPITYGGSRYAQRLPIGTEQSLRTSDVEAARRFWQDWYRPDLMAVIAVGDFDVRDVVGRIEATFGDLQVAPDAREWALPEIPDHEGPRFILFEDPELPVTALEYAVLTNGKHEPTHRGYREFLLQNIFLRALQARLDLVAQEPGSALIGASVSDSPLNPERATHGIFAQVAETRAPEALRQLLIEAERARRHGFTVGEVERAKSSVMVWMQEYFEERENTDTTSHAEEIVRVFTTDEPMPGEEYEWLLAHRYVPGIDAAELSAFAARWLTGSGPIVALLQPDKPGLELPTQASLQAAIDAVAALDIPPPEAEQGDLQLLASLPEPGRIVKRSYDELLNTTEWTLGNGARVLIRTSDVAADEILFGAWSPGGIAAVDDGRLQSARVATDIAARSGAGELTLPQLVRWLNGRQLQVWTDLGRHSEALGGYAAGEDLEVAMQLMHAAFVAPRFDQDAFDRDLEVRRAQLRNADQDPGSVANRAIAAGYWGDHPRYRGTTLADLDAITLEDARAVYEERFADAGDFVFVFVGTATPHQLEPLVKRYLASLPSTGRVDPIVDEGARPVDLPHAMQVRVGTAPRATSLMRWQGPVPEADHVYVTLRALTDILDVRLRERLREALGGTYGAGVQAGIAHDPPERLELDVSFQCDPSRVDELKAALQEEIAALRSAPPTDQELADYAAKALRAFEESRSSNGYWLRVLLSSASGGEDPRDALYLPQILPLITTEAVGALAAEILTDERLFEAVHLPASDAG